LIEQLIEHRLCIDCPLEEVARHAASVARQVKRRQLLWLMEANSRSAEQTRGRVKSGAL
jgi:hypothetical protein